MFTDIWNCLNKSYEYTEACVSLMEAKLSLRGYELPPSPGKNDQIFQAAENLAGD